MPRLIAWLLLSAAACSADDPVDRDPKADAAPAGDLAPPELEAVVERTPRSSVEVTGRTEGTRVVGLGSLFRLHAVDRELTDYRSTRTTAAEGDRLVRLVRRLMEHGVLMSITGLGCLSTPMGEAELEGLVETFAAVLET